MRKKKRRKVDGRKQDYIRRICESIVSAYGPTLVDSDTDLRIAEKVYARLKPFLYTTGRDAPSRKEFKTWRAKFKQKHAPIDQSGVNPIYCMDFGA